MADQERLGADLRRGGHQRGLLRAVRRRLRRRDGQLLSSKKLKAKGQKRATARDEPPTSVCVA